MEGARVAEASDLAAIATLLEVSRAELASQRGGPLWTRKEARETPLEALLGASAPSGMVVLAGTIDDVVVGYVVARSEAVRGGEVLCVVDEIYVEPEARGVGVGGAMMDLLITWATDAGCTGVDAMVLPGSRHTKNFFERFGLTARAIIVHRSLL